MWSGIVSFLGSIQSIRLKSLNSISKLELDTVLEKKGKRKKLRGVLAAEGILLCQEHDSI